MTCNLFIVWGDPTRSGAEIDEASFFDLTHAEEHVNEQRRMVGEKRPATILEVVESNDGGRWKKAVV